MATLPHIPDAAFDAVLRKIGNWLDMGRAAGPARDETEVQRLAREATDSLYQSLGLTGEGDSRAYALVPVVLAHLRGVDVDGLDPGEVAVGVMGITLGLMLAEATGWEPPLPGGLPQREGD